MFHPIRKIISQVYMDTFPGEKYISIMWLPITRGLGDIKVGKLTVSFWTWLAIGITYSPTVYHIGFISLMWE